MKELPSISQSTNTESVNQSQVLYTNQTPSQPSGGNIQERKTKVTVDKCTSRQQLVYSKWATEERFLKGDHLQW